MSTKPEQRIAGNRSGDGFFFLETPCRHAHVTFHRKTTPSPFRNGRCRAAFATHTKPSEFVSVHGCLLRLSSVFAFASIFPIDIRLNTFSFASNPFIFLTNNLLRPLFLWPTPSSPTVPHSYFASYIIIISSPDIILSIPSPICSSSSFRLLVRFTPKLSLSDTPILDSIRHANSRFCSTHHSSTLAFSFLQLLSSVHIFCLVRRHSDSENHRWPHDGFIRLLVRL